MRALLLEIEQQFATSHALDRESRDQTKREARLLVSAVIGCSPGELARRLGQARPAEPALDNWPELESRIRAAASRRARGEPLAYAVGTAAFRHLVLQVDQRVLIPRPETEIVVDEALRLTHSRPGGTAVDIGTGSGAIALSLATEGAFDRVIATDISSEALAVAQSNAAEIDVKTVVEFRLGADLAPLEGVQARVIVSNPPYIAYGEAVTLPSSVRDWEPATALFADHGGMARYEILLTGAARYLEPDGFIVLEVDSRRGATTAALARQCGWNDVTVVQDLSGRDRVVVARNPLHSISVSTISAKRTEAITDA